MSSDECVKVYCRIRPFNNREKELGNLTNPINIENKNIIIPSKTKEYTYDECFPMTTTQDDIFKEIGMKNVENFLEGYNTTVFVYGQTSSGKTWTMFGEPKGNNIGIIYRTMMCIFDLLTKYEDGWYFEIEVSFMELFMESVNDLLNPKKTNLRLREDRTGSVYVENLTKENITNIEEFNDIITKGCKVKKIAETNMNQNSSRSHCILTIYLTQTYKDKYKDTSKIISSKFNLVDLAGSERISKTNSTGEILKQGTMINLSLSILSQVINGLSEKSSIVPYRSSKLTRLLQSSLGGNSHTSLIIHLSPHIDNLEESLSTLEFGKRVKNVKNSPRKIIQKTFHELEQELEQIKFAYVALQEKYQELQNTIQITEKPTEKPVEFINKDLYQIPETVQETLPSNRTNITNITGIDISGYAIRIDKLEKELLDLIDENEKVKSENIVLIEKIEKLENYTNLNTIFNKIIDKNSNNLSENTQELITKIIKENEQLKEENFQISDKLTENIRRLSKAELELFKINQEKNKQKNKLYPELLKQQTQSVQKNKK